MQTAADTIVPSRKQKDLEQFVTMLQSATQAIQDVYMQLPVASKEEPVYRERVYCYELYHCLRKEMERLVHFNYFICGELDKAGHPLFRDNARLNKAKPDFLVHIPRDMNNNLVAVEVKAINASPCDIVDDLKKLTAFCLPEAGYYHAIYLIFGEDPDDLGRIKKATRNTAGVDTRTISLFWHRSANVPAEKQAWDRCEASE